MKQDFLNRMKDLLKEEYPAFEASLEKPLYRGVRINPLKITEEVFLKLFPYPLVKSPFCKEGYYLPAEAMQVGNHPLHAAGAIYIQEPSASAAVEILDVKEGETVLDLCAAPGGKSTQIAAKLAHSGLLVANEYDAKRAQILMSNMERMGFGEAIITNAHPDTLCDDCAGWFDKVLVDAPCSGEGMMKKHDAAADDWSKEHVKACGDRQVKILLSACDALKENGVLVYSTCTYAKEENEEVVSRILQLRDDIEQVSCNVSFGRKGFVCEGMDETKVCRIFPMDQGEGHFIAKFRKIKGGKGKRRKEKKAAVLTGDLKQQLYDIVSIQGGYFDICKDKLYYRIQPFLDMGSIHVLRQGILCGEIVKKRLEPHQHLFMSSYVAPYFHQVHECSDAEWLKFQSGEELAIGAYHGYVALAWHSLIVGFGKGDGRVIKNKYPKGLRKR